MEVWGSESKGSKAVLELEKIRRHPFMDRLDELDLVAILSYLSENEFAGGDVILKQGQVSAVFHIIIDGKVDVYIEQEVSVYVARLERGHVVGEMSCLTGECVSATVVANEAVRTLSMPRDGLFELMERSATFRKQMLDAMIQRIGQSNERVVDEFTRSAVVTKELEEERQSRFGNLVGHSEFMQELREKISQLTQVEGPICIVGESGVGKFHIANEIHRLSSRSQYPLLIVDGESFDMEQWHVKLRAGKGGTIILKQADVLPAELLHRLAGMVEQTQLIMTMKKPPSMATNTIHVIPLRERAEDIPELVYACLSKAGASDVMGVISEEALQLLASFPFIRNNVSELNQVIQRAFILSEGKTIRKAHLRFDRGREPGTRPLIGLALGSGSVRGAAHVGVLKVLEEEGIPVDLIAGTSVGAFIGALYAGGQPISAFEKVLPTVRWRQLVHFTMPHIALVENSRMSRFVEKYIGPVDFEDLPIPFAAVASDAVTGESYILKEGRVSHAIRATTAIPGVMKPVRHHDRWLVDGAVVHPVPVALAKSMGADIVIAVDVSVPSSANKAPQNFVSSILNTIEIMSRRIVNEELQLADVVLHPQIGLNKMTFKSSAAFIQAGEVVTREAIAAIKQRIDEESQ